MLSRHNGETDPTRCGVADRHANGRVRTLRQATYGQGMTDLGALIARNVRAERSRRRMTQQQLADLLGVSRPTVTAIEIGRRPVAARDLPRLCRALGVPLIKLLDGADDQDLRALGLK